MSLPKKKKKKKNFFFFFFFRETPTSPWVPFRAKFRPPGRPFRPSRPLAWSLTGDSGFCNFRSLSDKVPHRRLLYKLDFYGIRRSTHKKVNSWLSGRTRQVVIDNQTSGPVPILSGVAQGSVLGLILFLIFINYFLAG